MTIVAGVDGCRAGWIAVFLADNGDAQCSVLPRFAALLNHSSAPEMIAVDMPIGLPDHVGPGGRGPERLVRARLGARQSSVFSIPARAAVFAEDYRAACAIALQTSEPPRKVSRQGFGLFARIRELDALMTPALQAFIRESHPELAFTLLNGGTPMRLPKKVKSRPNPDGIEERRQLLVRLGYPAAFLEHPPQGAGLDDLLDASVLALVARRIASGTALSFPPSPECDARGLAMAIWG